MAAIQPPLHWTHLRALRRFSSGAARLEADGPVGRRRRTLDPRGAGPRAARERVRRGARANGETALSSVYALRPQAIVLDVMMPGVDGIEVCRRLRASGRA